MNLDEIRIKIDELDRQLVELLELRAQHAANVAAAKREDNSAIFRPDREAAVFRKVIAHSQGILPADSLKSIYSEIMSAMIALESRRKVAYLGPVGTYAHEAALRKFGQSNVLIPARSFMDAFEQVAKGDAHYAVLPLENSTEGMVKTTLDLLLQHEMGIYAEIRIRIRHNLLSRAREFSDIRTVYSHPQGIAQCRRFLEDYLPQAALIESSSTARAAEIVSTSGENHIAAISSRAAADFYGLPVVREGIQDAADNFTRFIVIGPGTSAPTGNDRTLISFELPDQSGALYRTLEPVYKAGVNMTAIESRPRKGQLWSYTFFMEFEGHQEDPKLRKLIHKLRRVVHHLRIIGSYPVDNRG